MVQRRSLNPTPSLPTPSRREFSLFCPPLRFGSPYRCLVASTAYALAEAMELSRWLLPIVRTSSGPIVTRPRAHCACQATGKDMRVGKQLWPFGRPLCCDTALTTGLLVNWLIPQRDATPHSCLAVRKMRKGDGALFVVALRKLHSKHMVSATQETRQLCAPSAKAESPPRKRVLGRSSNCFRTLSKRFRKKILAAKLPDEIPGATSGFQA